MELKLLQGRIAIAEQTVNSTADDWLSVLGVAPRKILKTLADTFPEVLSKEELTNRCGMTNSGTFRNYVSMLRGYELV